MRRHHFIIIGLLFCLSGMALAEAQKLHLTTIKSDKSKVKQWNAFIEDLYVVHQKIIAKHKIKTTETFGGYAGLPKFYKEVSYFNAANNQLLTRIQYESKKPKNIHQIELFIYDDQGKVTRDYLAAFLPKYRNAPIITLINLHHYQGDLHGFRQFDASGQRIYEQCRRESDKGEIVLSLEQDELDDADKGKNDIYKNPLYSECFGSLPREVGIYLEPSNELKSVPMEVNPTTSEALQLELEKISLQIKSSPKDASLYTKRGEIYFALHEFEESIADFSHAIELNEKADAAYFGRGLARGRAGYLDDGIADLSVYIQRHPEESRAYTKRGVRYLWKDDIANAEIDLRKAIDLNASNAEAHDDLGVICARQGKYAEAQQHFTTTVILDPSYLKGFHNLAMVHLIKQHHDQALVAINNALQLNPKERESLFLKAQILRELGKQEMADKIQSEAEFLPEGNWSEQFSVK